MPSGKTNGFLENGMKNEPGKKSVLPACSPCEEINKQRQKLLSSMEINDNI
jgi:hypothetical protein